MSDCGREPREMVVRGAASARDVAVDAAGQQEKGCNGGLLEEAEVRELAPFNHLEVVFRGIRPHDSASIGRRDATADDTEVFELWGDDLRPLNGVRRAVPIVRAERDDNPPHQGFGDECAVR